MNNKEQLDAKIYQMHANICKTFTAPIRLMIIEQLKSGEKTVSDLEQALGVRQATLSQHLAVLREKQIVVSKREGQSVYYKISNPKIIKACGLMREILMEQIAQNSALLIKNKEVKYV